MSGDAVWLDARLLVHDEAIVVTPAMAAEMVGAGSQYLTCYRDANEDSVSERSRISTAVRTSSSLMMLRRRRCRG
jgi:hypothetical protein